MALVDEQGRLFGRWNLVDAALVIVLLGLVPLSYGAYVLFRAPNTRVTAIEPNRALSSDSLRITIRGENLRPYMRVSFNERQGRTFLFVDPTLAEVEPGELPPGIYDMVLYDHAQERARVPKALTIEAPPQPATELDVIGTFTGVDQSRVASLKIGLDIASFGKVSAVGKSVPASTRVLAGDGRAIEMPLTNAFNVPVIVRISCRIVVRGTQGTCMALGTTVAPEVILTAQIEGGPILFQVDQVRPVLPIEAITVRVRLTGEREAVERVAVGDVDQSQLNELARGAAVVSAGGTQRVNGASLTVSVATPTRVTPAWVAGDTAVREVTLRVPAQRTPSGWSYMGQTLLSGSRFIIKGSSYELAGTILEVSPPR